MKKLTVIFLLLFTLSSCVKNNDDPSWIEISEWTLEANSAATPGIAGELTHNFSDAWVYVDGELLGVFELPCKVPVLKNGSAKITLLPTIKDNGISATKRAYPFVESYIVDVNLVQNQSVKLNPVTRYYSTTKFWKEDFGDPAIKISEDPNNTAHIIVDYTSPILKWGPCGHISLSSAEAMFLAYTSDGLYLSQGAEVYLEIDYYNTNSLTTGLLTMQTDGTTKNNVNITLNAQDVSTVKWKKIYIALKELVSNSSNANQFKISLQAAIDDGLSSGDVYVDNIKIVY
ncbi:MAG: hypothetical protein LW701_11190 [Fluviicola sp.]|jgi:hypothetical protein|nr:hypothetical protein [Fluviicola sp.]